MLKILRIAGPVAILLGLPGVATASTPPAKVTISVPDDTFPRNTLVREGGTITWVNKDTDPHTVTSDPGSAPQKNLQLAPGHRVSVTFTKRGHTYVWHYRCTVHAAMKGQVTVVHP